MGAAASSRRAGKNNEKINNIRKVKK